MEKVMEELRQLTAFWAGEGEALPLVGLMLSSRKNLCIHPEVKGERDGKVVDARCHALTAPHVREKRVTDASVPVCSLYETFDTGGRELAVPSGVYNLEDLKSYCGGRGWCPYYFTRWAIGQAQVGPPDTWHLTPDTWLRWWSTVTTTCWIPRLLRSCPKTWPGTR